MNLCVGFRFLVTETRWWFHFFLFSPLFGEGFQFDEQNFSKGLVQPPTSFGWKNEVTGLMWLVVGCGFVRDWGVDTHYVGTAFYHIWIYQMQVNIPYI